MYLVRHMRGTASELGLNGGKLVNFRLKYVSTGRRKLQLWVAGP